MPSDTITVTDNRTGKTQTFPLHHGNLRAMDLRSFKTDPEDFGVMTYDPAYMNTACCHSAITFIDGDKGILRYRGYPIEVLAEKCNFLEVAYLLLRGELPNKAELDDWTRQVTLHTMVHENVKQFMNGFHYDAHPMAMLVSTVAALSTFYPGSKHVRDAENRKHQILRLVGKFPTIAAYAYRHSRGLPYVQPDNNLGYVENFMAMLWKMTELKYEAHPDIAKVLNILFILHADHEQNCSASAMRLVGSSEADPYLTTAGACAALSGPLHGGANEAVLKMLDEIGTKDRIPAYLEGVKKRERLLMGFGHRIYKNYDPRARIIKWAADRVFAITGANPKLEIALELERIALSDEYFIQRKLYPNVDFYSGIIYQALGFNPEMFTVLFAIPRTVGWLAQWEELLDDSEQKISRPRQIYTGHMTRDFVAIEQRNGRTGKAA